MAPPPREPPKTSLAVVASTRVGAILVLLGLSLVTYAYKRALEPLYGSAATNQHLTKVVWASCLLGSFAPSVPISRATLGLGLLLYALPHSSYWAAVYTGRMGDPIWGTVATHLIVLLPILSLGVAIVKALQEAPYRKDDPSAPQSAMTLPVCATAVNALQGLWPALPFIATMPESQIFLQLGTACAALWAIEAFLPNIYPPPLPAVEPTPAPPTPSGKDKKRKKGESEKAAASTPPPPAPKAGHPKTSSRLRIALLPLFPFLTSTILRGPTLPKPLLEPYQHPLVPFKILSSVQSSYSGVVVVGQILGPQTDFGNMDHLRYLRAGHSLLGGVWTGPKAQYADPSMILYDEAGESLGDSIYSAFVLQEVARLVVKKPGNLPPKNALMIGLGAGIAATSFMRHDLDTTIVEIDPAVYDAAHRYFGLPAPGPSRLFIEDARGWVHNRSLTLTQSSTTTASVSSDDLASPQLFDIVVHDCFSGGSVPSHLYTQEFWRDLKNIVRPDGVVAVNFAGILESPSGKAVIHTLQNSFPRCRAFYDSLQPNQNYTADFLNWVFFCTLSPEPVEFRKPVEEDYLGSHLRRHVFTQLPAREADVSAILSDVPSEQRERYLLRDAANPLGDWQRNEAIEHWKIMRGVLPDVYWETY
ncbi:hypothetical protein GY45DRAFT_1317006 [Cubamyces sp. BRFM 1775]|nr:hypothetical protein GY45DRAFT_1317006 [Cubamyces sp. BRFM 1775]